MYWQKVSLKDTIKRLLPEAKQNSVNENGKIIFENNNSNIQVVYDLFGNYFRIQDKNIPMSNRSAYLDLNGKNTQNIKENGTYRGMTKKEFQAFTHYANIDDMSNWSL